MTKLSDTRAILLSTAAQRDTPGVLPLPASVRVGGANKAIAALRAHGPAEKRGAKAARYTGAADGCQGAGNPGQDSFGTPGAAFDRADIDAQYENHVFLRNLATAYLGNSPPNPNDMAKMQGRHLATLALATSKEHTMVTQRNARELRA